MKDSGFTLVEMIAAVMIIAIIATLLATVNTRNVDFALEAANLRTAKLLASRLMEDYYLGIAQEGEQGDFAQYAKEDENANYSGFTWTITEKRDITVIGEQKVRQAVVTVHYPSRLTENGVGAVAMAMYLK